ncbi:hypothetical protein I3843_02G041900 [Carya illinoinensis]|nr:hypothetical protein I3843_02G041900 [Carya illinoinensis]
MFVKSYFQSNNFYTNFITKAAIMHWNHNSEPQFHGMVVF